MQYSTRTAALFLCAILLTACNAPNNTPSNAPTTAPACPTELTAQMSLPQGARVIGKIRAPMQLWSAEVASGSPAEVPGDAEEFSRGLSSERADNYDDDDGGLIPLPNGDLIARYSIDVTGTDFPGEFEHFMLACDYGVGTVAPGRYDPDSVMLLIPLPYKAKAQCDVVYSKDEVTDRKRRPLISASCELLK